MNPTSELERVPLQTCLAKNRVAELQQQLETANCRIRELTERLTLSAQDRAILRGRPDGCVRVGELQPILCRIFGDAA